MLRGEVNQQRLTLLASILLWEGRLNNARLREIFDLSSVRASEWIREFRETYPGWTEWNSKTRSYHATMKAYRSDGGGEQHFERPGAPLLGQEPHGQERRDEQEDEPELLVPEHDLHRELDPAGAGVGEQLQGQVEQVPGDEQEHAERHVGDRRQEVRRELAPDEAQGGSHRCSW